jgi:hypothetical protein
MAMEKTVLAPKSKRERELLEQGWSKQFLASGARLQEAKESYLSLGFDVHLEPAQQEDLACSECQRPQPSSTIEGWYVIYTRPRPSSEATLEEDELW